MQLQQQHHLLSDEKRQLSETIDRQQLRYDQLKTRASAYFQKAGTEGFENSFKDAESAMDASAEPSDAEIELELLQRKDAAKPEVHP